MKTAVESVRSLWVPLAGTHLLLPNVAVAEVISHQPYETLSEGPDWLIGVLRWREVQVPVVSMERLFGLPGAAGPERSRIAVINSVIGDSGLPFYAIVTSGIPRLFSADEEALGEALEREADTPETVACRVRIGSEVALVPDMVAVQSLVARHWDSL